MTNQEKKQQHWAKISSKFKHLENHCTIKLKGIEDDSIYYHPTFGIEKGVYISSQCDVGNNFNTSLYCPRFTSESDNIYGIELYESYMENVIVSWKLNKEVTILAFDTLKKVNSHVEKMRQYTNEYVNNLLVGNSIVELSNDFINEIKTTTQLINLMQKNNKTL
jgi:hypothetical protein